MSNKTLDFDPETQNKLTEWQSEPKLTELQNEFTLTKTVQSSQITKIGLWREALAAAANFEKKNNRSSVCPKLIRKQAEWRYSALSEPFLSTDKIFDANPVTFEDTEVARQNDLVLNWQFNTKLDKIKLIDEIVRATVNDGTCIVRLGWEREETKENVLEPVYNYFEIEDEQSMALLEEAIELKKNNPRQYNETVSPEIQASVDYFESTGIPVSAEYAFDQEVERVKILKNQPDITIMEPGNVYVDPSCEGNIDKALFIVETFQATYASLKQAGYINLDKVNWESNTRAELVTSTPENFRFADKSRNKVQVFTYWGYYDINNDNTLKPIVVSWIGSTIIRMEESPFPDGKLPFVFIPYMPIVGSVYGEPDAELILDNQNILGAITRGAIDLLGRSAAGQTGTPKGLLDAVNRDRFTSGQDFEYNPSFGSVRDAITTLNYPEISQSAITLMQMQSLEAESLTGTKAFSGGISGDSFGKVATGARGAMDAAAKREMAILRRIAKGVCEVGTRVAAMNAVWLSPEESIRVTNEEYVSVNPEDLKGNFDLSVDISTAEVDEAKSQHLGFLMQTLAPNSDWSVVKLLFIEYAKLRRMPALAEAIRAYEPQPDPMAEQLKQLELAKVEAEIEEIKARTAKYVSDAGFAESRAAATQIDTEQNATGIKHQQAMEHAKAQAMSNQQAEIMKTLLRDVDPNKAPPKLEEAIRYLMAQQSGML